MVSRRLQTWATNPFRLVPLSTSNGQASSFDPETKPGKYLVQTQFYGHRQQIVAGATTLQVKLTTAFGTPRQREQLVTLRLQGQQEVVTVGEFVVGSLE